MISFFKLVLLFFSSPTRADLTNSIRHSRLVARFNDLYAVDRLDMQVGNIINLVVLAFYLRTRTIREFNKKL